MTVPSGIILGDKYRDIHTGFVGAAMSVEEHINGCITVHLESEVNKENETKTRRVDDIFLVHIDSDQRVNRGESQAEGRLGRKYRDTITGFEGIATQRSWLVNGSIQIAIDLLDDEKHEIKAYYFDEDRLIDIETKKAPGKRVGVGGPVTAVQHPRA